jgi:hypothetical protein
LLEKKTKLFMVVQTKYNAEVEITFSNSSESRSNAFMS